MAFWDIYYFSNATSLRCLFTENSFPMGNAQICPRCEHIKYKLKLFNGVFFRRATLHTFISAYAKVNSLNIKGSKNTYLVYYYVQNVDMLFCIPMWQGRAAFCTISLSVRGPHEIATRAAVAVADPCLRPFSKDLVPYLISSLTLRQLVINLMLF